MRVPLGIVAALFGLVGAALHALNAADGRVIEPSFWLLSAVAAIAFGVTGGLLAPPRMRPLSSVLLGIGLAQGVSLVAREYALIGDLPLAAAALWVGSWLWAPAHLAVGALLPLLLPEGVLPSSRWRPAVVLAGVALALQSIAWALSPYHRQDVPFDVRGLDNPVGVDAAAHPVVVVATTAVTLLAVGVSLASLGARWHGSTGEARQQLKWLALGGAAALLLFGAGLVVPVPFGEVVAAAAVLPLPVAVTVAALRHRLWEVDLVVGAGLRYAVLSGVVIAVYASVVSLLGARSGAPVIATAVVAVVLLPLHDRVQRWVNEWVHGEADDPATALARLGERLETTIDPADVADHLLPGVISRIAELLRAPYVGIRLSGSTRIEHGSRPSELETIPLRYAGREVGELEISTRLRSRSERRRVDQLAGQAAVAVHSVLLAREAREARRQAVTAREEERRRLRRDLHDEVGPVIAALALQAETARDLVDREPRQAAVLLDRLVPRLNGTVADVRALVHELRPPTLDELGLAGAVRELAARFRGPGRRVVACASDELGELPAAVELAAYRIVSEALSNAVRHGRPRTVTIDVVRDDGRLLIEVVDDGAGIRATDPPGLGLASMRERAEELNGACTVVGVDSPPGTRVAVILPLMPGETEEGAP